MMGSSFVWKALLCLGLLLASWVAGWGCAECRHDVDCLRDSICISGRCTAEYKPPPTRRTPPERCVADGELRDCYTGPKGTLGAGLCRQGKQSCSGGHWSACQGQVLPSQEICDGKDNDCNGQVDEDFPEKGRSCQTQLKGPCLLGVPLCQAGQLSCEASQTPQPETCNGKDDDCDGTVDQGCSCTDGQRQPCGPTGGICKAGTQSCSGGKWGPCIGATGPQAEVCDGKDNNCDGKIDEGCDCQDGQTRDCGKDAGECKKGRQQCQNGRWGSCAGEIAPQKESCNGLDDDCDGQTDEGCQCQDGQTRDCGKDTGACQKGSERCAGGRWGACKGSVGPASEACNLKDDDCDGTIDEGATCAKDETCLKGGCVLTCNPPHSKPVNGTCLPSCGAARGQCSQRPCISPKVNALTWDCTFCCK